MVSNFFHSHLNAYPIDRLLKSAPWAKTALRPMAYRTLFGRGVVPGGTCIFSDFDLLNTFALDAACRAARAAEAQGARVLNHPSRAPERVALLRRLKQAGLSPVGVWRLEDGERPTAWPVFIRCEDGAAGSDTGLLDGPAAFEAALADLIRQGKSLKRRIAVQFAAEPDSDGYYRKYGAFVVGRRIIPQHILRNTHWMVKSNKAVKSAAFADEEFAYVAENPHAEALLKLATTVNIDFARIDYSILQGRIVVYEMNTNPSYPRFTGGDKDREGRRKIIARGLQAAFEELGSVSAPAEFSAEGDGGIPLVMLERTRWYQDLPYSLSDPVRWRRIARRYLPGRA